jgi:hypothetical protein
VTPTKSAVDTEQERAKGVEMASGVGGAKKASNLINVNK